MAECTYFLKAQFPSKKEADQAVAKTSKFLSLVAQAYQYYQGENSDGKQTMGHTLEEFQVKFPSVWNCLQRIPGETFDDLGSLSGHLDYGQSEEDRDASLYNDGSVLVYSQEVWHMADWDLLLVFLKDLGAIRVVTDSEEGGGSLDGLQLYDWAGIVSDILKKVNPHTMIGINKDLDDLLESKLKTRRKK